MYDSAKAHNVLGYPLLLHVSSAESERHWAWGLSFGLMDARRRAQNQNPKPGGKNGFFSAAAEDVGI